MRDKCVTVSWLEPKRYSFRMSLATVELSALTNSAIPCSKKVMFNLRSFTFNLWYLCQMQDTTYDNHEVESKQRDHKITFSAWRHINKHTLQQYIEEIAVKYFNWMILVLFGYLMLGVLNSVYENSSCKITDVCSKYSRNIFIYESILLQNRAF